MTDAYSRRVLAESALALDDDDDDLFITSMFCGVAALFSQTPEGMPATTVPPRQMPNVATLLPPPPKPPLRTLNDSLGDIISVTMPTTDTSMETDVCIRFSSLKLPLHRMPALSRRVFY